MCLCGCEGKRVCVSELEELREESRGEKGILRLLPNLPHISQILRNPALYFSGLRNTAHNQFSPSLPIPRLFFVQRTASAASNGVAGCPRRIWMEFECKIGKLGCLLGPLQK